MAEKQLNTRIQMKTDTSTNWAKATNFIPKAGEIIVYSDLNQIKVGDGSTSVVNLPFASIVSAATTSVAGLMSAADKTKLEGIATGANKYTHPSYTTTSAAAAKIGRDSTGHVVIGNALTYSDVGAAATSHTHYDTQISWGGNLVGDIDPNIMGCIDEFGHNKLAFLPASCIQVHYSTDGGSTWIDYGLTDAQKVALVTTAGSSVYIGKNTTTITSSNIAQMKLRIRIACGDMNKNLKLYTSAKKWLINVSTFGASNCTVSVRYRTIANYLSDTETWTSATSYSITGWSGWNAIPATQFGGSMTSQTSQTGQVEFIFGATGAGSSYSNALSVIDIRLIGASNWATPSELARAGHLYTMNTSGDATFPGTVTATSFNGNATTATAFAAAKSVTLTGDITGSASSIGGWNITTTIGDGKITNTKLANSSISIAGNNISLGGSVNAATLRTSLGLSATGSATQPVYINADGIATATTYKLEKSVPSNAIFTDTTYSNATTSTAGLMSASDKSKLDDIETTINNAVSVSSSSLILSDISDVTATASEVNVLDGITATTTELNYTDGVTSNIQTQLNNKMAEVSVTTSDNGKFLQVVNGAWAAVTIPEANGQSF